LAPGVENQGPGKHLGGWTCRKVLLTGRDGVEKKEAEGGKKKRSTKQLSFPRRDIARRRNEDVADSRKVRKGVRRALCI